MNKLIIFDYDGVIVDSFLPLYQVYKSICRNLGIFYPSTVSEFRDAFGYNHQELFKNLGIKTNNDLNKAEKVYRREVIKHNLEVFPGIKETLKELSQDYILVILSANYRREIVEKLKKEKLFSYFTLILGKKDTKTQFLKTAAIPEVLERFKVNKNQVISIGDRNIDYDSSKKCGLKKFIIADYGWGFDKSKAKNKLVITAKTPLDIIKAVIKLDKIK
ncbi:MAG: HAD family hydrolase [Planctomycetes bacterium]|jgi:phosphoglycolate phosphatase-like HAD superfamily hydrolase|nr:HAD family hydrolase [Planctomycetota bacterium]